MTLADWHRRKFAAAHAAGPEHANCVLAAKLAEECGEVAQLLVAGIEYRHRPGDLAAELADVVMVAMTIADVNGVTAQVAAAITRMQQERTT